MCRYYRYYRYYRYIQTTHLLWGSGCGVYIIFDSTNIKNAECSCNFQFHLFYNLISSFQSRKKCLTHYLRIISTIDTLLQEAARWTVWRTTPTMCSASAWRRAGWPPGARGTRRYTSTDTPGRYLDISTVSTTISTARAASAAGTPAAATRAGCGASPSAATRSSPAAST